MQREAAIVPERSASLPVGRRWWIVLFAAFVTTLVVVVATNFVVDPLHLIRGSDVYVVSRNYQRMTNAGRIRTDPPFQAAVVGSSYIGNFDPALIEALFGVRTEVFSVFGGSSREQRITRDYLLGHRPHLRYVFLEASTWGVCGEGYHPFWKFPLDLYDDSARGNAKYLASFESLLFSAGELLFRAGYRSSYFSRHPEATHRWYETWASNFDNPAHIANAIQREIPATQPPPMNDARIAAEASATLKCMDDFISLAKRWPATTFYIFNPPLLQMLLRYREQAGLIAASNIAQEAFVAKIADIPNIRYFDFLAADSIERDCRRFMDVGHFDPAASDQLVRWMHDGTYQRTAESNASISAAVRAIAQASVTCPPE